MNIHHGAQREPAEASSVDACRLLDKGLLFEESRQFRQGATFDHKGIDLAALAVHRVFGRSGVGWWECELADDHLTWTTGVYEIFGLPACSNISRAEVVSLYAEGSRAIMERLRGFAIARHCGFMLDAEIMPVNRGRTRWMRIVGMPVSEGGDAVRLHGLKLIV